MTNDQIVKAIQNLIERVNRNEAATAEILADSRGKTIKTVDEAIRMLDHATDVFMAQTEEFQRLKKSMLNGK